MLNKSLIAAAIIVLTPVIAMAADTTDKATKVSAVTTATTVAGDKGSDAAKDVKIVKHKSTTKKGATNVKETPKTDGNKTAPLAPKAGSQL